MNILSKIKNDFYLILFSIVTILIFYSSVNIFSYYDPMSLCSIRIEKDIIGGNGDTIRDAIKLIKKEDHKSYKMLCQNIDRINENECSTAHGEFDADDRKNWEKDGCYINGSKVILLKPEKEYSELIVRERAETIKKYASYSEKFWREKQVEY